MKTNDEIKGMYPGIISMSEWVFSQTGPVLLNVIAQLLEKYPELDTDVAEMMIIARAVVADRKSCGCSGKTGSC